MIKESNVPGPGSTCWKGPFALVVALLLVGCGTVFGNKTQPITIESNPPGAFVVLNHQPLGPTPVSTVVPSDDPVVLTLAKAGLPPKTVVVLPELNNVAMWDTLFYPFFFIDWAQGTLFTLGTNRIVVNLQDGRRAELYNYEEPMLWGAP